MKGKGMWKKAKAAPAAPVEPVKSASQLEAERAIERGKRIEHLSTEAAMWRKFSAECKPGRYVYEHVSLYGFVDKSALMTVMDSDTAPLWKAFADQMAQERERRLKDVLGV